MDARIILAGQQPDLVNVLARSTEAAGMATAQRQQNALRALYQSQGPQIMAGDPNALNALGRIDPMLGMGVQSERLNQQNTRQLMSVRATAAQREAEKWAAERDAAEVAREVARAEAAVMQAAQFVQAGNLEGANAVLTAAGSPPLPSLDVFPEYAATVGQALEKLKGAQEYRKALTPEPKPEPAAVQALRIRAAEAGLEPGTDAYAEFMRRGGTIPQGMAIETTPDGGMRFVQGEGVTAASKPFTEQQSKDNVFVTRARGALEVFEPVADTLTSRGDRLMEYTPMGVGREYQDPNFQVAQQAGDEFLQAILRKDTGAAITEPEQALYGATYLPRPGDGPAVLEAKRQARIRAVNAIEAGMSPAQMVARDRALVNAARESAGGRQEQDGGGPQVPDQAPDFLNDSDRGLWDYMTPVERETILKAYPEASR